MHSVNVISEINYAPLLTTDERPQSPIRSGEIERNNRLLCKEPGSKIGIKITASKTNA